MTAAQHDAISHSAFDTDFKHLRVRRLAGRIGAEIHNLALSGSLDDAVFGELLAALLKHKVVFLRGQSHLDDAEHQAFGARFGKTVAHPTVPAREGTRIFELDASKGGGRADS